MERFAHDNNRAVEGVGAARAIVAESGPAVALRFARRAIAQRLHHQWCWRLRLSPTASSHRALLVDGVENGPFYVLEPQQQRPQQPSRGVELERRMSPPRALAAPPPPRCAAAV
eukprot:gene2116-9152_t